MKGKVRFGILGAFAALAGVVGVVSTAKPTQVDAQIPAGLQVAKTCNVTTVAPGGNAVCVVTITATAAVSVAEPIVLTVGPGATGNGTNPEFGRVRLLNGTSGATGPDVDNVTITNPANGTNQSINVNCTGATCDFAVGDVFTITEGLQAGAGGPTIETLKFGANTAVNLTPTITVGPAAVDATVTCTPATITAGAGAAGTSSCLIDFVDTDAFAGLGAVVSSANVTVTVVGPAGVVLATTGTTTGSFNCGVLNGPQSCDAITVVLQSNTAGVSGPVTLQINYAPDNPQVDGPIVLTKTAVLAIAAATGTTATLSCTPIVVSAGSGAAGQSTCTVDLNDTSAPTTTVSSGTVAVTLSGTGGILAPTGTVLANGTTTQTFRCPLSGTLNTNDACDSITFTVTSNTANVSGAVNVQIVYTPDLPQFDNPVTQTFTNVLQISTAQNVAAFLQPAGLIIACTSNADPLTGATGTFGFPAPAQLLSVNVIAVGVLPVSVGCTVRGVDAAGAVLTNFAPGTIEVSSTGGTLLDAQGRLAATLRIGCDASGVTTVVLGTVIQTNTCTGVSFFVSGQGVGTVELRARYEPSSVAAAAGIQERETLANVGFVAPVVAPSLLLSPNPVVVGQTGTATVRFNRTINCTGAFTTGFASTVPGSTTSIAGGSVCIDPTTGQPIIFNLGSGLNGSVVLTIADTSIAQWATAVTPTNIASPQSTGFTDTVSQAVRRCGFFPTTGITAPFNQIVSTVGAGNLSNFFGGCDTVTATYRGVIAGVTNVTATFIPDLPGAFGNTVNLNGSQAALLGLFGPGGFTTSQRVLQVENAAPVGTVQLSRGCNNVSPTVSEAASAYAARVAPAAALVAIWEHQAATNTFRGFSPQAGAPSDLAAVTRLRPVFVCVSGAATLDQPPA